MASSNTPTFFVEFHLPLSVVNYIETFTTRPVDSLAKDFLFDALARELPLVLPVPSRAVIGCFSVFISGSVTVIFSVSASHLTASILDSVLRVLLYDWIAFLSGIRAPNLPVQNPAPLDVDTLEQSSLILLPSEESHFSAS
ncbi:ORF1 [reindeer adenovirus 1]|uniref:ORF1 n=1 Tax=reindeer adenovirus 1 TaxID=2885353 RepID=A0AAE8Y3V7_9ADEN|nr:ORF1 [reindeer adenovirus 1]